jgi:hypothetical protein
MALEPTVWRHSGQVALALVACVCPIQRSLKYEPSEES